MPRVATADPARLPTCDVEVDTTISPPAYVEQQRQVAPAQPDWRDGHRHRPTAATSIEGSLF